MIITCLIPFLNERDRILRVLAQVTKVKGVHEILCVDDGSTDGTSDLIKKHYPRIKIIRNPRNLGKTEAITFGLNQARGDYIFLLDADLRNLNYQELEDAIFAAKANNNVDMVILRRVNAPFIIKLNRGDILLSGERILRRDDLLKILDDQKNKPNGFQLEFAINQYMVDQKKRVYWMPSSALNTYPMFKRGFLKGIYLTISMQINILSYIGFKNFVYQELFFCKKELT